MLFIGLLSLVAGHASASAVTPQGIEAPPPHILSGWNVEIKSTRQSMTDWGRYTEGMRHTVTATSDPENGEFINYGLLFDVVARGVC